MCLVRMWRCGWVRVRRSEQVGLWGRLVDVLTVISKKYNNIMYYV